MQLTEQRGFQAAEIGRLMNLPPVYVNAPSGDSLTYATTESNRRELADVSLAPYVAAINQRLSMPDVTPTGTTITLDLARFLRGDLAQVVDTAATAVGAGLMSVDEVRDQWFDLPPLEQTATQPDPGATP
jgi:phage portal protein BeeE